MSLIHSTNIYTTPPLDPPFVGAGNKIGDQKAPRTYHLGQVYQH